MTQSTGFPLRVWAPEAQAVAAIVGEGARHELQREDGGWWASGDVFPAGTDYQFSIDDGEPLPDPRSRWQPNGVHGPSRVLDPAAFIWRDQGWQPPTLATGLVYEAHVGTFSAAGTFEGMIEHLDHLIALGVTHLELMPVAEFAGQRGWGYDGVDLFAPHSAYGGPAGLARLVDECHARGLAVLLDVVYNHLGPAGNYLARFAPYFSDRYSTPWGEAVNLDGPGSDEVRRFLIDNALMWLRDYHIDGLRLDAVHAIFDMSAAHFLEQLASEVHALQAGLGRDLVVIAESDLNDPRLIRPVETGGYGLDAQWSDDFHHALHALLADERSGYYADFGSLADVGVCLTQGYRYAGDYSAFRGRRHGRPQPALDGRQLLGFLQNHDQIGNRALGERSGALMSEGRLMIGAALVLSAPFVPMLFQGEEWAAGTPFQYFSDHDPELGRLVSVGRREEFAAFGWQPDQVPDPQAGETFERSRLDWSELREPQHQRLLDWHRRLVALRRAWPELANGRLNKVAVDFDEDQQWLRFTRGRLTIAVNLANEPRTLKVEQELRLVLGSADGISAGREILLPPESVAVLALV